MWRGAIDFKAVDEFLVSGCNKGPCAYWILAVAYLVLAFAALVQFVRIQLRLADSGWTLQKAFHLFNVVMCLCRGITLFFWHNAGVRKYTTADLILLDLPTLMFFTTYSLLALFWAEIVHSTDSSSSIVPPRYTYLGVNFVVYLVFAIEWILIALGANRIGDKGNLEKDARTFSTWFQFGLYGGTATVFVVYGSKLFSLLKDSPVAPDFKRRKMIEVFMVGALCVLCFLGKSAIVVATLFKNDGGEFSSDTVSSESVWLNSMLLGLTEVLVVAAALGMLSDLPPPTQKPEGGANNYQPVPDEA